AGWRVFPPRPTARCRAPTSPCRRRRRGHTSCEISTVAPDRLDGGRVLSLHARDDDLIDECRDRLQAGPEVKQIAHAGDAAGGLDIDDENAAIRPERVPLDPARVRPGHAQHSDAHVADGHVGHQAASRLWLDYSACDQRPIRRAPQRLDPARALISYGATSKRPPDNGGEG